MRSRIINAVQHHFYHPNYLYFLLSLLLLIFLPPLADLFKIGKILSDATFGAVILMAALYTSRNVRKSLILLVLGSVLFWVITLDEPPVWVSFIFSVVGLVFFSMVFWNLVSYVLRSRVIKLNDVFAAIAGYLVLGILAAPYFFLIENAFSGAFTFSGPTKFYDFLYFSYITLTTVGFGDISPVHPLAKSFTMVLGIVGQMYLTILVGIIIGKYLVNEQSGLDE